MSSSSSTGTPRLPAYLVEMRVEFRDAEGLTGAVVARDVSFQTVPAAGDLLGPGLLPAHADCSVVDHLEHFFAPSLLDVTAGTAGTPGTVVVVHLRWPGEDQGEALLAAYQAAGWTPV